MKLLLDENLSERIVQAIADLFPGSAHVNSAGLKGADDGAVWDLAKSHGFTIVSKDTDFRQRALLFGPPPKFIWLRVGNCPTSRIVTLLRARHSVISRFIEGRAESLLILEK